MTFTILPAIDVRDGAVVRLVQGDYARQTTYGDSPIEAIRAYAEAGASWLHLVDLDAARLGRYSLAPLLGRVRAETALSVQTGGGVRSASDVEAILESGASRVVIGTLAVKEPSLVEEWVRSFGAERITLAMDTRRDADGVWRLPVRGWTENTPVSLVDLLARYADAGARHVLCTDIDRDGTLEGFNVGLYRSLAVRFPSLAFQASGGASSLDDIRTVKGAGAAGAILGRALLDGRFTLSEALAC